MKAMLLAAGKGKRLYPLTKTTPKPLIPLHGRTIIEKIIEKLATQGITEIVINVCHLAEQIMHKLGDGERYGVSIEYSIEKESLETAGGIANALPMLGEKPFLAVNSDIVTDYPFAELKTPFEGLAHLVLVNNPENHSGDFALDHNRLKLTGNPMYTYSGIAVYKPEFFKDIPNTRGSVTPYIKKAIANNLVSGEHYSGTWYDIGSMQQLRQLA